MQWVLTIAGMQAPALGVRIVEPRCPVARVEGSHLARRCAAGGRWAVQGRGRVLAMAIAPGEKTATKPESADAKPAGKPESRPSKPVRVMLVS